MFLIEMSWINSGMLVVKFKVFHKKSISDTSIKYAIYIQIHYIIKSYSKPRIFLIIGFSNLKKKNHVKHSAISDLLISSFNNWKLIWKLDTAWKESVFGPFSGPCFASFGLNTNQENSKYELFSRSGRSSVFKIFLANFNLI